MATGSYKGAPFSWADPFLLEDQLTEEERMVAETARGYAMEKLMPRVISATRRTKASRSGSWAAMRSRIGA